MTTLGFGGGHLFFSFYFTDSFGQTAALVGLVGLGLVQYYFFKD